MVASEVLLQEPAVPFERSIRPQHGQLFALYATSPPNAKRFSVNFCSPGDDTALHIDSRFNERAVVRNNRRNGVWGSEERAGGRLPIHAGRSFEMMVLMTEDAFKIAYNGAHFADYTHRVPLGDVSRLQINGDVNIAAFHESRPPMDLMAALSSPAPPGDRVCLNGNAKERSFTVEGGLRADQTLHICGVPGENVFNLDFLPHDKSAEIGLHLSCRVKEDAVVVNNRLNMKWQTELRPPGLKVARGRHFELEITARDGRFFLLLDGDRLTVVPKRHIPPDALTCLKVHGDVTLINVELVARNSV